MFKANLKQVAEQSRSLLSSTVTEYVANEGYFFIHKKNKDYNIWNIVDGHF